MNDQWRWTLADASGQSHRLIGMHALLKYQQVTLTGEGGWGFLFMFTQYCCVIKDSIKGLDQWPWSLTWRWPCILPSPCPWNFKARNLRNMANAKTPREWTLISWLDFSFSWLTQSTWVDAHKWLDFGKIRSTPSTNLTDFWVYLY